MFVCLFVCLGNNKSWKQELEEKQTNLNRQVNTRVVYSELVLFELLYLVKSKAYSERAERQTDLNVSI